MARYKGREYTVVSYPTEEYSLVISDKDGNLETVKLSQVTLNKQEATEFLKREQHKMEVKKVTDEHDLTMEEKRIEADRKAWEAANPEEVKRRAEMKKVEDAKKAEIDKAEQAKSQALAKVDQTYQKDLEAAQKEQAKNQTKVMTPAGTGFFPTPVK